MTINLSLILKKHGYRNSFRFPFYVFTDSLVVSASQDAGGHTLSCQNNLTFGIGLHVVGVRTAVRTTGHPGSVIVPQYGSSKITMFVWGKNTILKFRGNTK